MQDTNLPGANVAIQQLAIAKPLKDAIMSDRTKQEQP
jgi:hypothetical protein